jgi:3'(2'), 5'-bisphosphate nucleotidase
MKSGMDYKELNDLLELGIWAAKEASKKILNIYNSGIFQTEVKEDNSPLTIADKNSHDIIVSILESSDLPILSEEGKNISYEERKNWTYLWMVDPLDGTKEFIKRNGEFTVNIALIKNDVPIMGVVAVPTAGEICYSISGHGAFLKSKNETIRLPNRKAIDLEQKYLRVIGSSSHMNEDTRQFINSLNQPQFVSAGSSLKFILLAIDKADVYPRFAPTMEWDTAAGHAIVKEVGFKVFQKDRINELAYNKSNLLNPDFICL